MICEGSGELATLVNNKKL